MLIKQQADLSVTAATTDTRLHLAERLRSRGACFPSSPAACARTSMQVLGDAGLALVRAAAGVLINPLVVKLDTLEALVEKAAAPCAPPALPWLLCAPVQRVRKTSQPGRLICAWRPRPAECAVMAECASLRARLQVLQRGGVHARGARACDPCVREDDSDAGDGALLCHERIACVSMQAALHVYVTYTFTTSHCALLQSRDRFALVLTRTPMHASALALLPTGETKNEAPRRAPAAS